jgi:hypothetical protein
VVYLQRQAEILFWKPEVSNSQKCRLIWTGRRRKGRERGGVQTGQTTSGHDLDTLSSAATRAPPNSDIARAMQRMNHNYLGTAIKSNGHFHG